MDSACCFSSQSWERGAAAQRRNAEDGTEFVGNAPRASASSPLRVLFQDGSVHSGRAAASEGLKRETGDFGGAEEADLEEVADAAVDVEGAVGPFRGEVEEALGAFAVDHGD